MRRPDTKYVAIGDADVAYQVLGEGPSDLLFFNGLGSNVEMAWEDPVIADFLRRLASLRRLIFLIDEAQVASDGVPRNAIPTWEEWTEDIESVLDVVGSKQTSILATVDAGPIAILYAAAHPERVDSFVLCNTTARYLIADDYPIGFTPETLDFVVEFLRTHWGTPEFLSLASAAGSEDPVRRDALARLFRSSVTPRTAAAQYDYLLRNLDVRPILPFLRMPTLVLSADNPSFLPMTHGRHVADHIEGSKFVELPGRGHADLQPAGPDIRRSCRVLDRYETANRCRPSAGLRTLHRYRRINRTCSLAGRSTVADLVGSSRSNRPGTASDVPRPGGQHDRRRLCRVLRGPARAIRCPWPLSMHATRWVSNFVASTPASAKSAAMTSEA